MNKIRVLRDKKKMSQQQLGKILNVSRNTVSQYETETREPNIQTLMKLANYFNVSIDYILGYRENSVEISGKLPEFQQEIIELVQTMNETECLQAKVFIETMRKAFADKKTGR